MKIVTRMLDDEVYETGTEAGIRLTMDSREASLKQNQSPVEALLSSISVCGAIDITLILKKRKKTIVDFVIEADGVRRDEPPRRFTKVHCKYIITSPDVTEEELNKTAKLSLEKYCSVVATLNCPVTFSVEIIRP